MKYVCAALASQFASAGDDENATTIQHEHVEVAARMPSSIASFARYGGASAVARRGEQRDERQRGARPCTARAEARERADAPRRAPPATSRRPWRRAASVRCEPGCQTLTRVASTARRTRARAGRARGSRGRRRSSPSSSSCGPRAATRPSSSTTISSASAIVESRWAMMIVVRPAHRLAQAEPDARLRAWRRPTPSRRRGSGCAGRRRSARAIAIRWRWPPESVMPRSPTTVS